MMPNFAVEEPLRDLVVLADRVPCRLERPAGLRRLGGRRGGHHRRRRRRAHAEGRVRREGRPRNAPQQGEDGKDNKGANGFQLWTQWHRVAPGGIGQGGSRKYRVVGNGLRAVPSQGGTPRRAFATGNDLCGWSPGFSRNRPASAALKADSNGPFPHVQAI